MPQTELSQHCCYSLYRHLAVVLMAACLLGLAPAGRAAQVSGLYQVEVPVADRSPDARQEAMKQAMAEVLVRVTGERDAAQLIGVDTLLQEPGRYVQQFLYANVTPAAATLPNLRLQVRFDGKAIERVLREYGLPVWGQERPALLLWLAYDTGGQRQLLAEDSVGGLADTVRQVATARGLPLLLPLLDIEDQRKIGVVDVWGGFKEPILAASDRYQAQAVLAGRLQPAGAGWQGRWTLYFADDQQQWESQGDSAEDAVGEGLNGVADRLALRLAVRALGTQGEAVRLVVDGVDSNAAYSRVMHYLAQLTPVRSVQVSSVTGTQMELVLALDSDPQTLSRLIAVGRVLDLVSTTPELVYRLRP